MRLALAFLIILFMAGCGQKTQQSPSVAPPASSAAEAQATTGENPNSPPTASSTGDQVDRASASAPNGVANVASTKNASPAELAPVLSELTQALRKYSFEHRRLPKTFGEVIAAGYVKNMPQAPPGKKFEIDPKTVQVVLMKQ